MLRLLIIAALVAAPSLAFGQDLGEGLDSAKKALSIIAVVGQVFGFLATIATWVAEFVIQMVGARGAPLPAWVVWGAGPLAAMVVWWGTFGHLAGLFARFKVFGIGAVIYLFMVGNLYWAGHLVAAHGLASLLVLCAMGLAASTLISFALKAWAKKGEYAAQAGGGIWNIIKALFGLTARGVVSVAKRRPELASFADDLRSELEAEIAGFGPGVTEGDKVAYLTAMVQNFYGLSNLGAADRRFLQTTVVEPVLAAHGLQKTAAAPATARLLEAQLKTFQ